MDELIFKGIVKRGDHGPRVKLIQELLCLNDVKTAIDSVFGPATEQAVREYQNRHGLLVDGVVGEDTFRCLTHQIMSALKPLKPNGRLLHEMVIAYARQHLLCHPREVGGQNRGPWVRLYMNGLEGSDWPWCAGFVSFVLKQACDSLTRAMPIDPTFSCYIMATEAIDRKIFLPEAKVKSIDHKRLNGCIFLVKKGGSWSHTGIVIEADDEVFSTIEGNSNDEGSYEGYEVCRRIHSYENKDFILL